MCAINDPLGQTGSDHFSHLKIEGGDGRTDRDQVQK